VDGLPKVLLATLSVVKIAFVTCFFTDIELLADFVVGIYTSSHFSCLARMDSHAGFSGSSVTRTMNGSLHFQQACTPGELMAWQFLKLQTDIAELGSSKRR
jgi:hypothetical protein